MKSVFNHLSVLLKNRIFLFSYFIFLFFNTLIAFAQTQCVSGRPEKTHLIEQLNLAKKKSSITKKIYKKYKLDRNQIETPKTPKEKCENSSVTTYTELQAQVDDILSSLKLDEIETQKPAPIEDHSDQFIEVDSNTRNNASSKPKKHLAQPLLFNTNCMKAGNQFEISGVSEVICPEDEKIKKSKLNNSCLTEEILTYQNAVITNLYNCMKSLNQAAITPDHLFKLYNREAGFNPHYHSVRGRGIGQLTSVFVHNNHQAHRGGAIMEQVQTSTTSQCEIAKKIADKAITKPPLQIRNDDIKFDGYCAFTSIGDGLELNILYTLVGLASSWKYDVEPLLREYMEKYESQSEALKEIKSLVLLNAYGASGPVAAIAALKRLRGLAPKEFIKQIQKPMVTEESSTLLNKYILDLNSRASELHKKLPIGLQAEYDEAGDNACINPKAL